MNIIILSHDKDELQLVGLIEHLSSNIDDNISIKTINNIVLADNNPYNEIVEYLNKSSLAMIVISSHYLSDDMLYNIRELSISLHDKNALEVIQIIAKAVLSANTNSKRAILTIPIYPLTHYTDIDDAYSQITSFVLERIEFIKLKIENMKLKLQINELESALESLATKKP